MCWKILHINGPSVLLCASTLSSGWNPFLAVLHVITVSTDQSVDTFILSVACSWWSHLRHCWGGYHSWMHHARRHMTRHCCIWSQQKLHSKQVLVSILVTSKYKWNSLVHTNPYLCQSNLVNGKCLTGWPISRQCEIPWRFAALGMLSVTHIMPILVLNTCMDANMQFTISFRQLFPVKFPNISRFSRQVVTLD